MTSRGTARLALIAGAVCALVTGCRPPAVPPRLVSAPEAAASFDWQLPPGAPVPLVPADNPMSAAKVALGRRLFYDTRLSGNGTYSCASCHEQARAFTDGRAHALGSTGAAHPRSAMSLTNVAYNATFGWANDRLRSLEAQMAVPMFNEHPIELGLAGREAEVVNRFRGSPADVAEFRAVFAGEAEPISIVTVTKAIASFERTLISADAPLDHYLYRDDRSALSPAAVRGMTLFFSTRLRCSECHAGFNLSGAVAFQDGDAPDIAFHNTALYNVDGKGAYPTIDQGLLAVTGKPADMGRFRAPTLRNIAVTAPYMHDGSIATLDAAIDHYARGGGASPLKSNRMTGFSLSADERADVVAFLGSLTDQAFLHDARFGPQR